MRILHINKFLYRRGGAERYLFDVAAELARRGHEVSFFGVAHADNVPLEQNRFYPPDRDFSAGRGSLRTALAAVWSREAARKLAAYVERVKPRVAHLHNTAYHLTPAIIPVLADAGVATVMTQHDYNLLCPNHYFYSRHEPCYRCAEGHYMACITRRCVKGKLAPSLVGYYAHRVARRRGVYRRLNRIIVQSRFMFDKLVRAGYDESRLVYMQPANAVRPAKVTRRHSHFLYAGRLAAEKGIDVAIAAVARSVDPAVVLRIAGDGPEGPRLRRLAEALPPGRVEFLGRLDADAVAGEMTAARAIVIPSVWPENTPAVIVEALATGTPVVASRIGGVPEMIADGVEGMLFEPGDVAALAGILERLARDPAAARKMGAAGRLRFARHFDFGRHVDGLEEIYGEIAA